MEIRRMKTVLVAALLVGLAGCEETTTVSPAPIGQMSSQKSPYVKTTGTVQSGAVKTIKR
jgi:hypothetical protein